jgi:hypothetical protein
MVSHNQYIRGRYLVSRFFLPLLSALEGDEEAKRVREWRHKLQKAFLTPRTTPSPDVGPQFRL